MENSAEVRFWSYVGAADAVTGCMPYLRYKCPAGYGRFRIGKKVNMTMAHRHAFTLANGPIPPGMKVLHRCDNPPCCNPDHLFLGTQADNIKDMMDKGRNRQPRGANNAHAKLSDAQVAEIRALRGVETQAAIGRRFGIRQGSVSRIQRGESWTASATRRIEKIKGQWAKGDNHGRSKLTQAKADEIRALRGKMTAREIAEMYGISRPVVSSIHNGKAWVRT